MSLEDPPEILNGPATMQDVARRAGVSIKSVSRVINDEPHVSAKLRRRIELAIEASNYVPDLAARSLAGGRSFTIGVLFDNPSPNYTMKVQSGIYRACMEHKYHLRIDSLDTRCNDADLTKQLAALLHNGRIDGFVLTPPISDNRLALDFLEQHNIHFSRLAPMVDALRSPAARMDDFGAAQEVADMLWSLGHRRFAIINGHESHGAAQARRSGFIGRLLELDPSIQVAEACGAFDFIQGIEAGRELLAGDNRPTAIFAANDDSAVGAMVAIRELGLQVPDDISICGFDDSWTSMAVWPLLTTVRQPIEDMAYAAAKLVIDRPSPGESHKILTFDHTLVERTSVGPAP